MLCYSNVTDNAVNYCQFCVKIVTFHCHDNSGQSGVNFNDTVKLHDLENSLFRSKFWLHLLYKLSCCECYVKIDIICCYGNKAQCMVNFNNNH